MSALMVECVELQFKPCCTIFPEVLDDQFLAEGRPDGARKDGKMRPKFGNIRPVWARPSQNVFF